MDTKQLSSIKGARPGATGLGNKVDSTGAVELCQRASRPEGPQAKGFGLSPAPGSGREHPADHRIQEAEMTTGKKTRSDSGRDAVRAFNKRVLNPAMLRLAGRKHWYVSVLRHTGRRSGKPYATPVVAARTETGFIIPLPYGTKVDWLQNLLAAGHATIEQKGDSHEVVNPTIIDAAAAFPQLSHARGRTWRLFGIQQYVQVRDTDERPEA
ncbi:nitroreductase family deazaflavin-dependent oxidoreductase [Amycolatopsis sp. NPDC049868]|uniref:nitroreductase family deazaflavin-dependent oxidoreductase n=1 Tax=Amycolatopsis sp. NPDC049868 TaxID=3363934 RepID=UPI00378D7327